MRIGFVTQWYPPEPGTGLASSIAESLVEQGHHVDVLTGFPNYPTGRLQPGYPLRPYRRELLSPRLTLHRAPLLPSHDASALHRMANYGSFALSSSVLAALAIPRPDVWLVYSSPATAALAAVLPRPHRAPVALLIQDLWPDSVLASGFLAPGGASALISRALHRFCDWTYQRSDAIGVISPSMTTMLVARGVPERKISYVPNWALDTTPASASRRSRADLGLPVTGTVFLYAGNMGALQDLTSLVSNFPTDSSAQLVLMGNGVAKTTLEQLAAGLPNVHVRDGVPATHVSEYLDAADVLVVSLSDQPLLRATMPSKVQTFLSRTRPILVHGAGDVADVVLDAGAGAAATPGDVGGLRAAVSTLANATPDQRADMGRRAREQYLRFFDRTIGAQRLTDMLHKIARKDVHP